MSATPDGQQDHIVTNPVPVATSALPQQQNLYLRAGGVSLLLSRPDGRIPAVAHWGADLGELTDADATIVALSTISGQVPNNPDVPMHVGILAEPRWGWAGRPGLTGHRDGLAWAPDFSVSDVRFQASGCADGSEDTASNRTETTTRLTQPFEQLGAGTLEIHVDSPEHVGLVIQVELTPEGVVRARATVTNTGDGPYRLEEIALALPVPARAHQLQDFAGHWGQERAAQQRRPFTVGVHLREGRKGRTGADAAHMILAGEQGFGFSQGEVWGVHTAFSGNHRTWAEREYTGQRLLGGSELLMPGEVTLSAGENYTSPWIYGIWGQGLDAQANRLHSWIRSRPQHPHRPRPATLNVWEAVYFDHNLPKLTALAERAAQIGIERFVLDDGWFGSRRDDTSGLGDWVISEEVWPDGLTPLIQKVTDLGMEFGLWFEPEMVNLDSDVARAHPEWVLAPAERTPVSSRFQHVLDLGNPEAYAHVRDQMVEVLSNNRIGYIKWDHNRDLLEAGSSLDRAPGVHRQTLAAYGLMAELKERFPGLEIESCSSGGARVDLGVLEHTDRFWTSDCIDPAERQEMHRWTQQLVPPELMGSHVASGRSHQTDRLHAVNFRAGTALWGHFGVEWDLTQATQDELDELSEWVELYKSHRDLLHNGTLIRVDAIDPEWDVHGVVSADQTEALFAVVCTGVSITDPVGRLTLRGLNLDVDYVSDDVTPAATDAAFTPPAWWPNGTKTRGSVLQEVGLHAPQLRPDRIRLIHLTAR
ncbi:MULTISPECIES: alpha-galactosidase [Kocuria]|uniref:alpha-galactosidase n=1 Tax=Kocuria TaxID=57493 RepID=UPI001E461C86|nr:alpha-galactosidase [Kocuria sp. CPCC 104605]